MKGRIIPLVSVWMVLVLTPRCGKILDAASFLISDSEEIRMGHNVDAQIRESSDYPLYEDNGSHNRDLVTYIEDLGQRLADAQGVRKELEFHFQIIDRDDINAFAVPGGFVYIYTGLIKKIIEQGGDEAMLASVLAHEIAHITLRHGVKRLMRTQFQNMAIGLIAGDREVIAGALGVVGGLRVLKYSRDNEFEADGEGLKYVAHAGINPKGMQDMLQMLADMSGGQNIEFLSTHPDSKDRVSRVKDLIDGSYSSYTNIPRGNGIPLP